MKLKHYYVRMFMQKDSPFPRFTREQNIVTHLHWAVALMLFINSNFLSKALCCYLVISVPLWVEFLDDLSYDDITEIVPAALA